MMDGFGIQGMVFHYAVILSLVGGAFLLLLYFWWKGRLDFDEKPKIQMMEEHESRSQPIQRRTDSF